MGGNNALLYALGSQNSKESIINYLIEEAGADPDSMNDYTVSCLLMATKKDKIDMIKLLLKYHVDISFCDKNGCNALHIASVMGKR